MGADSLRAAFGKGSSGPAARTTRGRRGLRPGMIKLLKDRTSVFPAGVLSGARLVFAFVCGTLAVATAAHAQASRDWTATVTPSVTSQYLFRGVRLGGAAFQPDVQFASGTFGVGVWSSVPLKDKVAGRSDPEIDPYAWYRFTVSSAMYIQPGATVYTYPRAEPSRGFYRATFEPSVALTYTTHGVALTPKVYYDVVLDGPTYELNAAYAVPVKQIGSELDFYASIGTYEWRSAIADATPHIKARGDYWSGTVSLPFQVSTNAKVVASVGYGKGSNNTFKQGTAPKFANPAAVGRVVVTLGYAVTF